MALLLLLKRRRKWLALQRKRKGKYLIRPIFWRREEYGKLNRLIEELRTEDREYFLGKTTGKILRI